MTTPALHTISAKGRELLVRIAEAQADGAPLSDLVVDLRHMKTISELVDLEPKLRANGKPAIGRSLVVNGGGRYVLAALGRADLSRALRPSSEPQRFGDVIAELEERGELPTLEG